jgi:hypothetical protein
MCPVAHPIPEIYGIRATRHLGIATRRFSVEVWRETKHGVEGVVRQNLSYVV